MNEMPTYAIYNRSTILTYYQTIDKQTGVVKTVSGSAGNEALVREKQQELIGSNVVAELVCQYDILEPKENGYMITQVNCFDPKGWLPAYAQKLGTDRCANVLRHIVTYLQTGE